MKIKVESIDILNGRRWSISSCPVARAIRRHTNAFHVIISSDICINNQNFEMPSSVDKFIKNFDNFHYVTPFEFEIPF